MVTSLRVMIGLVGVVAGIILFTALADRAPAAEYAAPVDEARRRADDLLRATDRIVARLESGNRGQDARPLAQEADRLRVWLAASFRRPPSSAPELHAVGVQMGGVPPADVASEIAKGAGYAEVRVSVVGRPIVLALSSHEPMHWHVLADPKVQLLGVLIAAASSAEVSGLADDALILNADRDPAGRESYMSFAYLDGGEAFDRFEARMRELTGLAVESMTGLARYDGRPLRVGPESAMWRSQVVVRLAERLRDKALAMERAPLEAELSTLRFSALYYQQYWDGPSAARSVASGEFSIKGPIVSSLRSRAPSLTQLIHDRERKQSYALDSNKLLIGPPGGQLVEIKPDPNLREAEWRTALAYDKRRQRLVIPSYRSSERALVAYDLTRNEWSQLSDPGDALIALTYAGDVDAMFAIPAAPADWSWSGRVSHKPQPRKILKLAPDGRRLATIEPSEPLDVRPAGHGFAQLVYVDGKLLVLGRPWTSENGRAIYPIQVLDPNTGHVLYAGGMRPQNDAGHEMSVPVSDSGQPQGRLARWIRGIAAAEKTIASYRRSGQMEAADKLARQLAELRRALAIVESGSPTDEPELYVVGASGARQITVELTDTSQPIVLAVSSSASIVRLSVPEDVRLLRVFADRQILDVPPGVPVRRWPQGDLGEQMRLLTRSKAVWRASMDPHGVRDESRLVLGPEDGDWRLDHVLPKLERLNAEHQIWPPAPDRTALEAVRFRGMYRFTALAEPRVMGSASAEFTIKGPELTTLTWRHPIFRETYSAVGSGELFGWAAAGVFRRDHALDKMFALAGENAPHDATRIRAVAHNRLRDRLLATTEGSDGQLYAYRIDQGVWEIVRTPGIEAKAMCHAMGDDSIYVLRPPRSYEKSHRIAKYTAYGVRLGEMPVRANSPEAFNLDDNVQLADAGEFLALVTCGRVDTRTGRVTLPRLYLVDRETGQVLFTSVLREHVRPMALADREISAAYDTLMEAGDADAERLIWKLASGGDKTVAFLAVRVGRLKDIDRVAIQSLIAKLDSEKFAVREQAQRELAARGAEIEPLLAEAAVSGSAEVRARVKRLLEPLQADPPVNPVLKQQCRGLEVLARIENPAAAEALRQISRTASSGKVARRATELVEAPKTDEVKWDERNGRIQR